MANRVILEDLNFDEAVKYATIWRPIMSTLLFINILRIKIMLSYFDLPVQSITPSVIGLLIGQIACEMASLSLPIVVMVLIYRSPVTMIKSGYFT